MAEPIDELTEILETVNGKKFSKFFLRKSIKLMAKKLLKL
jgi:hypothetical protein